MSKANGAKAITASLLVLAVGLSACTRVKDHKGYVVDSQLIGAIAPGIDNKDSVSKTLGRPTFMSEFDGGGTWYYWARETQSFGYGLPKPTGQTLLTIRFAQTGDVSSVQKTGMDTIRHVALYGEKTPTLGRNRSLLSELFGNIGAAGPGSKAPTADNPTGGGH